MEHIRALTMQLCDAMEKMPNEDRVEALNFVKSEMHRISPFKHEPVDCILWVKTDEVSANDYNPNKVAPLEMRLLEHSIAEDGYTQPIVTWLEDGKREVIDGFHRTRVGRESKLVHLRINGYLPVTTVNVDRTGRNDRIASTIRHNRARGKHAVDAMSEIVIELAKKGWTSERIAKELGMEADEVLRLRQVSGLAEMFAQRQFSEAWEVET